MRNFNQDITANIIINRLNVKIQRSSINDFNICEILFNNMMWLIKISITLMRLAFKWV